MQKTLINLGNFVILSNEDIIKNNVSCFLFKLKFIARCCDERIFRNTRSREYNVRFSTSAILAKISRILRRRGEIIAARTMRNRSTWRNIRHSRREFVRTTRVNRALRAWRHDPSKTCFTTLHYNATLESCWLHYVIYNLTRLITETSFTVP